MLRAAGAVQPPEVNGKRKFGKRLERSIGCAGVNGGTLVGGDWRIKKVEWKQADLSKKWIEAELQDGTFSYCLGILKVQMKPVQWPGLQEMYSTILSPGNKVHSTLYA
ncbi:hypothetical protein R6Z07F_019469 [Ovis aries]